MITLIVIRRNLIIINNLIWLVKEKDVKQQV